MGSIRPCLLITAALTAFLIATADAQSFKCTPAEWKTYNGILSCKTYGGKSSVIELADGGGEWTRAYQEVDVVPNAVYRISGEFYPFFAGGDCDNYVYVPPLKVTWCSPSVAVCSGEYNGEPGPVMPPESHRPPFPAGSAGCDMRSVRCCTAHTPALMHLHAFRLCLCSRVLLPRHLPELGSDDRPASISMDSVQFYGHTGGPSRHRVHQPRG
jgi:hypothetical protein